MFGQGNNIFIKGYIGCTGTEEQLINCSNYYLTPLPYATGTNYDIAGVICQGDTSRPTVCKHGDVRLVGGSDKTEGRVEFCSYGYWAVVCGSSLDYYRINWNSGKTNMVCKQLGLPIEG